MAESGNNKKERIKREQQNRMDIIAPLYRHGYTYREMQAEVKARLDLKTYALSTLKQDVDRLVAEWRAQRMDDVDKNITMELARIDEMVREAWLAWEKSKEDYDQTSQKQKGVPNPDTMEGIVTVQLERVTKGVQSCGDVRYLEVINKLLIERRKLLGLYPAEKRELTGAFTFEQALMQTGVEEDDGE